MKKIFFSLLIMLCSLALFSQKLYVGIKPGISYSSPGGQTHAGFSRLHRIGFTGGLFTGYEFTKHFAIQLELLYSQRGYVYHLPSGISSSGGKSIIRYQMNYLDIPILLKFNIGTKTSPYFIAGISPSFLISAKNTFKNLPYDVTNFDMKREGYVNTFNLGIIGGLGIDFKQCKKIIPFIEARYYFGSGNIYKKPPPNFSTFTMIYINSISLMAGIKI